MHDVISVTGHRPDKLGGYSNTEFHQRVERVFADWCRQEQPALVITGMALGFDTHVSRVCVALGIPFVAAVPFIGQESRWSKIAREEYRYLLDRALQVHLVSPGGFSTQSMHRRNHWMVDNSTLTVAMWDGSPGGTGECVGYAGRVGRTVVNLWKHLVDGFVS